MHLPTRVKGCRRESQHLETRYWMRLVFSKKMDRQLLSEGGVGWVIDVLAPTILKVLSCWTGWYKYLPKIYGVYISILRGHSHTYLGSQAVEKAFEQTITNHYITLFLWQPATVLLEGLCPRYTSSKKTFQERVPCSQISEHMEFPVSDSLRKHLTNPFWLWRNQHVGRQTSLT